ncbi:MAG: LamG-like jellyroll fold domain-containing protein [Vulcanimicrobiaceae bacterium]
MPSQSGGGFLNPMTGMGDMIDGGTAGLATRLAAPTINPVNGHGVANSSTTVPLTTSGGSDAGLPTGSGPISMELWFKVSTVAASPAVIGYGQSSGGGSDHGIGIQFLNATTIRLLSPNNPSGSWTVPSITDSAWHHLVVTVSGAVAIMYLDNVSFGSITPNPVVSINLNVSFVLGGAPASLGYSGSMSRVAVYNTVLSAARVAAHFNASATGSYDATVLSDSPLRYYEMEEPSGTASIDMGSQAVNLVYGANTTLFQAGPVKIPSNATLRNLEITPGGSPTWNLGTSGTITNDNATAGFVGEVISSVLPVGTPVTLTTATTANVTSIFLTAGDWDVTGVVDYIPAAATTTNFKQGSSSTSATLGGQDSYTQVPLSTTAFSTTVGLEIPTQRYSLAGPTTVYLVAQATFSAGGVTAYGTIRARRVR